VTFEDVVTFAVVLVTFEVTTEEMVLYIEDYYHAVAVRRVIVLNSVNMLELVEHWQLNQPFDFHNQATYYDPFDGQVTLDYALEVFDGYFDSAVETIFQAVDVVDLHLMHDVAVAVSLSVDFVMLSEIVVAAGIVAVVAVVGYALIPTLLLLVALHS
jgi:hypothetical protein